MPCCAACRDPQAIDVQRGASGRWLCEECRAIALALVVLGRLEPVSEASSDPPIEARARDPQS